MNILQVSPFFTSSKGGFVVVPYNLSIELSRKGHKVTIITTDFEFDPEYAKLIESKDVEVITFKCLVNFGLFLYSPHMKNWLEKNIQKFDVIHLHNFRSYQNNVAHHYAKKKNVPYILQAHGMVLPFFQKVKLKQFYDFVWGQKILDDASKVIALTENEAEQYKKMGINENEIKIIPNGINLEEYENLPEKGEFKSKYGIKNDEKIILFLGRIHKIKGVDLLINAFSEVLKEVDNVKLVIVGPNDGFLNTSKDLSLKNGIDDKVIFTGPLYQKDKLEAYLDAEVYVLPSVYESFGITILEACACGTPVICSNNCGIAEIINNKAGFSVDLSEDEMEKKLIEILNDKKLRNIFSKNALELIQEYNWDKIVNNLLNLYKEVIC